MIPSQANADRHAPPARLGDYLLDVDRPLGRGLLSTVYAARSVRDGRAVAVKLIVERDRRATRALLQLYREATVTARLAWPLPGRSPGVVLTLDVGCDLDGRVYVVTERKDGSLNDLDLPIDPRRAAALVAEAARHLAAVHARGVYHLDLKPGNLLWDAQGVWLADFGIARPEHDLGIPRAHFEGTHGYAAPEQYAGLCLGPATDTYALGAVLYRLLTGRPPGSADPARKTRPPRLSNLRRLNPDVPHALGRICLKALARAVADRYASAFALALALEQWQDAAHPKVTGAAVATAASTEANVPLPRGNGPPVWCDLTRVAASFVPARSRNQFAGGRGFATALATAEQTFHHGAGRGPTGRDRLAAATLFANVGHHLQFLGRTVEAEVWIGRAITLRATEGVDLPLAEWQIDRSLLLQELGQLARAEVASRAGLAIRQHLLSPGDPQIANAMNDLANLYLLRGRFRPAGQLYRGARRIWLDAHGDQHNEYAWALNNLIPVLIRQRAFGQAEADCQASIRLKERHDGPGGFELSFPLKKRAKLRLAQARTGQVDPAWAVREADRDFRQALRIREESYGSPWAPSALAVRNAWIESYLERRDLAAARELCDPIVDAGTGMSHGTLAMAQTFSLFGMILTQQGQQNQARTYQSRAESIRASLHDQTEPRNRSALGLL